MTLHANSAKDRDTLQRFEELVRDIRFAMLTTVSNDGSFRSRPMGTLDAPFDGDLWFFTNIDSEKVWEIDQEHRVGLSYAQPDKQRYVSVSGVASLIQDTARARELWTPAAKIWFPEGVEDPKLGLLRVRVETVEFWDAPSSKMVQLLSLVGAATTGNKLAESSDHRKATIAAKPE